VGISTHQLYFYNHQNEKMHLLIDAEGQLSLKESDNFKSFSIIDESDNRNRSSLDAIASPDDDNHYWITAESIIKLSPRGHESAWVDQFWEMLKAVEPYGFSNLERKLVKAHVET
jgi:hypothetical protein